jgi:hypothetical protein
MAMFKKTPQPNETVAVDPTVDKLTDMEDEMDRLKVLENIPPMSRPSSESTFNRICKDIMNLHTERNDKYSSSPVDELSISAWKYQIQIKATRALRATSPEKLKDELLDTAVYCILLLEKMEKEGV